ncbi:tRNA (adenosine(37)-N6)-threonylcarbamoyltransferase complex transferase subunit TsaD [Mollicutes bacterium LVI A0078]|nr:tRNA (adenosine(37)-N6)-threonylcarbamoyltransferase complex transferase subunit TsaD [Mollicutes bacterium LVI A0075]WOO90610.1 tRNA (adenosine(37)-N6)-threonylcarbamoyltransferase complex transferase subunit TsaD [Mollicutes bacterium LVI A0078]
MNKPIILAVETSCDETSIAIIDGTNKLHSLVTNTQMEVFAEIGGVVPEMASRMHVDNILPIYNQALKEAKITIDDIDCIAVTNGPGLVGALLIGVNFAKTIAMVHNKPIIGVNHLHGHIHALDLENEVKYPHLSLIVSGGHTELIYMPKRGEYQKVGQTLDDAAGESYDKVARILGVGYPGGPVIDKLAQEGEDKYDLPMPKNDGSLDFSFSGLKSASFNAANIAKMKGEEINHKDFACSFQTRVVTTLINKLELAKEKYNPMQVSIVGGVSANSELKKQAKARLGDVIIPSLTYSTDNAAMIASSALVNYELNNFADVISINANPSMHI